MIPPMSFRDVKLGDAKSGGAFTSSGGVSFGGKGIDKNEILLLGCGLLVVTLLVVKGK